MVNELWKEWLRISDYLLITMQSEMFFILYVVLGLSILYFVLQPFIRFIIALEWKALMTYLFAIIISLLLINQFIAVEDWRYVLYAILIFSIILSIKRGFSLLRKHETNQG
ncbi:hypothetical protein JCM21714_783 [Gracilibacillus boraciitolerans JCM 21714]|uniref:Uncharacterized protein n=1 Tax=Gracilibacillus boraciitolerans JCM 21714 TaxID=1298598 RepID=W4VGD0_9BACI|nr:hypothetical protein [Gracilibacillus boraciitolerans]GAE91824.1 hypothetical protein JCM21714_783 [Gracilibacillus boraciitolerans JCM 21714]